ncbi:RICIN domain-containing protein, partial [Kitasatospora nipponensis]|uniref:RICIN domain-containing protein n=1 Tax=Kitasatospora nipponensis TaxID=258049 RepID=UPI0031D61532
MSALAAGVLVLGLAGGAAASAPSWNLGNTALANLYNLNAEASGAVHNVGLNKCVDDYAYRTDNGSQVVSWTCNGATNQNWTFTPANHNPYRTGDAGFLGALSLNNAPTKCLDIPGSAPIGWGSKLQLWDCNNTQNQQWIEQFASNGSTRLLNPASSLCVDVPSGSTTDGTQLQLWGCNGSPAQWFAPPGAPLPPVGPITAPLLGMCADADGGGTAAGAKVQAWHCGSTDHQTWSLNQDGSLSHGQLCLDVAGGGTGSGTKVQLDACNATVAEQWIVHLDTANRTTLENPNSGRCLDIPNSSTTDGAQLQIWDCNNTNAQVWNAPQYPHPSIVGPVVAAPVVYPPGSGTLANRLDAMTRAEAMRKAQLWIADIEHSGSHNLKLAAGTALASNDADLMVTFNAWDGGSNQYDDPTSPFTRDLAALTVADQNRTERSAGRRHYLDNLSISDQEPTPVGQMVSYMSSESSFWRTLNSATLAFPVVHANQAAQDRVTAIAKENGAKDPAQAANWLAAAQWTNGGSADDVRRFIQYNGVPTVAPVAGTPEFRIEVEALKARWAGGDPTNPRDPDNVLIDVEETAWSEWQAELNSQAQQRADIVTTEVNGLDALQSGAESMNDALSYAWYAGELLWAQQNRSGAELARIPNDLGVIRARVAALAEAAKVAAGQAQASADRVQADQDAAAVIAKANGTPQARGLSYAQQSAQVTKAAASTAQAISGALQTALAATNATLADSATLLANASAQAHAARALFLRQSAQGDAALAASLASSAADQATAAASARRQDQGPAGRGRRGDLRGQRAPGRGRRGPGAAERRHRPRQGRRAARQGPAGRGRGPAAGGRGQDGAGGGGP